ncbi:MAG TPA: glycosyltransferase [Candidatus Eisenbacteria bacterium]
MPALSVLLPVRDAGRYLAPSLASLWRQTFADFDVIAVDDGSSDGSGERLERAASRERRLRVLHTPPRGLPAALNHALTHTDAPLIARHDADDLSHRERFQLQRDWLLRHPAVAVVGCRVRLLGDPAGGGMRRWVAWHNALLDHDAIAREALIDSPLAHATALLRREWLARVGGWTDHGWAEDLDLWLKLIEAGARFAKLPRVLYSWRQHPASATRRDPRYARERFVALKCAALARGRLRGAREITLVGTGRSLAEWSAALARGGVVPRAVDAGHPAQASLARLRPPVVLVFGTVPARARWRAALAASGLREREDFVFVA